MMVGFTLWPLKPQTMRGKTKVKIHPDFVRCTLEKNSKYYLKSDLGIE